MVKEKHLNETSFLHTYTNTWHRQNKLLTFITIINIHDIIVGYYYNIYYINFRVKNS